MVVVSLGVGGKMDWCIGLVFFLGIGNSWPGKGGRQSRIFPYLGGFGLLWTFPDWAGGYCRLGPYLAIWYPDFSTTQNSGSPLQNTSDKLNYLGR